jgi:hypothetical protein
MKYGLYTLILQSSFRSEFFESGWGNGYIFIPSNHPLYGKDYDDIDIYVHGGLTFSKNFKASNFLHWIDGREYYGDVTLDNYKEFDNYWIIGFDTAHAGDNLISCSKDYVMIETDNLLDQCLCGDVYNKYKNEYIKKLRCNKLKIINNI